MVLMCMMPRVTRYDVVLSTMTIRSVSQRKLHIRLFVTLLLHVLYCQFLSYCSLHQWRSWSLCCLQSRLSLKSTRSGVHVQYHWRLSACHSSLLFLLLLLCSLNKAHYIAANMMIALRTSRMMHCTTTRVCECNNNE